MTSVKMAYLNLAAKLYAPTAIHANHAVKKEDDNIGGQR